MKKFTLVIAAFFAFAIVITSCKENKKEEKTEMHESHEHDNDEMATSSIFQCPMDCEKGKTYGDKGSCPVCKMDLKSKEGSHEGDSESHDEAEHKEGEGHDSDSEEHGDSEKEGHN